MAIRLNRPAQMPVILTAFEAIRSFGHMQGAEIHQGPVRYLPDQLEAGYTDAPFSPHKKSLSQGAGPYTG